MLFNKMDTEMEKQIKELNTEYIWSWISKVLESVSFTNFLRSNLDTFHSTYSLEIEFKHGHRIVDVEGVKKYCSVKRYCSSFQVKARMWYKVIMDSHEYREQNISLDDNEVSEILKEFLSKEFYGRNNCNIDIPYRKSINLIDWKSLNELIDNFFHEEYNVTWNMKLKKPLPFCQFRDFSISYKF